MNTTAPDFVCLECRAREGKAVTLVRGVNDLETWCKQHNRQDILDAWDYNQGISPSEV